MEVAMKHIMGESSKSTLTNVQEGDVQPNAVDLRLGKVFPIKKDVFQISNDHKHHRGTEPELFLTSGLYDSGYHGVMAGVLHVTVGTAKIKQGTRIGQYLSFNAEALHTYNGDYGVGKLHDNKYGVK